MKKIILLFSIAFLVFTSCSSDSASEAVMPQNPEKNLLVKRIISRDTDLSVLGEFEFTYDGKKLVKCNEPNSFQQKTLYYYTNDLLTKAVYYWGPNPHNEVNFIYNPQNELIECNQNTNGFITRVKYVHNLDGSISYKSYRPNINTLADILEEEGKIYPDKIEYKKVYQDEYRTSYCAFDDKNHPFKNVEGFDKICFVSSRYFFWTSRVNTDNELGHINFQHNIIARGDSQGVLYPIDIYEYNEYGYPTLEIKTMIATTFETGRFEYTYY